MRRKGRIRRGNLGPAAAVGSHLDMLRIAAADHTGSDTRWGIAGRTAGSLLAAVRKTRTIEKAIQLIVGQVAWSDIDMAASD